MTIFHNHIPRTSGGVINHYIKKNKEVSKYIIEPTDKIDVNNFKNKQYIAGHIGQLPQKHIDGVISFSLVRDPKEQWLSWFWLMYRQGLTVVDSKIVGSDYGTPQAYMEKFLYDESYYKGTSNIQSKFLLGYVNVELWNKIEEPIDKMKSNWCLVEYNIDSSEIDKALDSNIVETVENRDNLIDFLNTLFQKKYKLTKTISDYEWSGHNTPRPNPLDFSIPDSWVNRINELNHADYYLYEKVMSNKKKYAIM
jgi:hypothetical protein